MNSEFKMRQTDGLTSLKVLKYPYNGQRACSWSADAISTLISGRRRVEARWLYFKRYGLCLMRLTGAHVWGTLCNCNSCVDDSHVPVQYSCTIQSILRESWSHHKLVALVCLSWHGLIDKVRSPGRVFVEVKHRFDPGEHAQHHHSNTQNIYSKSSFNHVNDFQVAIWKHNSIGWICNWQEKCKWGTKCGRQQNVKRVHVNGFSQRR